MTSTDHQPQVRNEVFAMSTVNIKLTSTVGLKLVSHFDIYLTIQLDVNLMLPNLIYVHEIIKNKIILYAFLSIMTLCISRINNMIDFPFYIR